MASAPSLDQHSHSLMCCFRIASEELQIHARPTEVAAVHAAVVRAVVVRREARAAVVVPAGVLVAADAVVVEDRDRV